MFRQVTCALLILACVRPAWSNDSLVRVQALPAPIMQPKFDDILRSIYYPTKDGDIVFVSDNAIISIESNVELPLDVTLGGDRNHFAVISSNLVSIGSIDSRECSRIDLSGIDTGNLISVHSSGEKVLLLCDSGIMSLNYKEPYNLTLHKLNVDQDSYAFSIDSGFHVITHAGLFVFDESLEQQLAISFELESGHISAVKCADTIFIADAFNLYRVIGSEVSRIELPTSQMVQALTAVGNDVYLFLMNRQIVKYSSGTAQLQVVASTNALISTQAIRFNNLVVFSTWKGQLVVIDLEKNGSRMVQIPGGPFSYPTVLYGFPCALTQNGDLYAIQ